MIPPRLSITEAVSLAKLLTPDEVIPGDIRLIHVDEAECRKISDESTRARFVEWPDRSVGFVLLDNFPGQDFALAAAYVSARFALEAIATHAAAPEVHGAPN